tara:strand:- start:5042 stop:5230 length:189 start_codon:yes stop_codon:yes gene_type:complete
MRIIDAYRVTDDGNEKLSREQTEQDMPEIKRVHAKAMKEDPTWRCFGGFVKIKDRRYQVIEH